MENLIQQDELRDSARRVLEGIGKGKAVSTGQSASFDRDSWKVIAELGWLGLAVPESHGGLEQPFSALAVIYQELGRVLSPQPFASAALGLDALLDAGSAAGSLIEQAIAGEAIVVPLATGMGTVKGTERGKATVLSGTVRIVPDAGNATHLLVPVESHGLFLVPVPHEGVRVTHRPTWDQTRLVFDVTFDNAEIESGAILGGNAASAALIRLAAHFDLALAADAIGGADAIFTETLAYMNIRQQFNRAIASFQALKHRCADWKTSLEASRSLADAACREFSDRTGDWRTKAALSRLLAGSMYRGLTEDAVQLHGGVGFTWEYSCHLYLKRARTNEILMGSPEQRKDAAAPALFRAASDRASAA